MLDIDPISIRTFYDVPENLSCSYEARLAYQENFPSREIRAILYEDLWFDWAPKRTKPTRKRYLYLRYLNETAMAWLRFIRHNINPSEHTGEINRELALLTFVYMKKEKSRILELINDQKVKPLEIPTFIGLNRDVSQCEDKPPAEPTQPEPQLHLLRQQGQDERLQKQWDDMQRKRRGYRHGFEVMNKNYTTMLKWYQFQGEVRPLQFEEDLAATSISAPIRENKEQ
ncbi:uncharacterized protein G2W53_007980 [Senna tora]|uniref:Uncharacterized protein n=1 Tax=Senna tora TaxID=362788 RepID=A0A834X6A1_9FABA|nr:uncharacterized protein G2W53_007980 [Senna tora]